MHKHYKMTKINIFLAIALFFLAHLAQAQTAAKSQYAAFYELGGNSFKSGVGIDARMRYEGSRFSWAANATLNEGRLAPNRYANYAPLSLAVSGLMGSTHSLEVGIGLRPRLHTVGKTYEAKEYSEGYVSHFYQNISLDMLPTVGYRVQPADGRFFGKLYIVPIGIGERSDGKYGTLNWFPLSEVQYSLMGLCLGFNLNKMTENDAENERPHLQHSVLLDYGQGVTYDLRFNHNTNVSFTTSVGFGARTFGAVYSPHFGLEDWNVRTTAIVGKKSAAFETGVQFSTGVVQYYEETNGTIIEQNKSVLLLGVPVGFRLQYPTSGIVARAYMLPAIAPTLRAAPTLTACLGLGWSF